MTAYNTYNDLELIHLLKEGDDNAFAEIYERYKQVVYRFGITLVKTPDLAEDLVQDVFIKLWDARGRLKTIHNFRSYLLRICHNRAIDLNKQIAANHKLVEQLIVYYQSLPDPETELSQGDLNQYDSIVEDALNSLTPQRRKVYELCKKENKSYEEVAQELNISLNTVKVHMYQTLALLRSYILKHGNIPLILIFLQKNL
ncbi:MAG: RNA polymerase sigma-70 factor [Chitinophagaceae bacterium]|nr:RNA polymerase sigma-70 factor [Chitinophagaceae bacterium]